jgi:hypothetical protein
MLGSGVLTFLAGAEIDPASLRANLRASMSIGVLSFLLPFLGVWMFAQYVLHWPLHQAWIAGIALSTTSVAVVYAVMIEGGWGARRWGRRCWRLVSSLISARCWRWGTVCGLQDLAGGLCGRDSGHAVVYAEDGRNTSSRGWGRRA